MIGDHLENCNSQIHCVLCIYLKKKKQPQQHTY